MQRMVYFERYCIYHMSLLVPNANQIENWNIALPETVLAPVTPVGGAPDFCCRLGTFGKLKMLQKIQNLAHFQRILV